jgi:hypothetical protein
VNNFGAKKQPCGRTLSLFGVFYLVFLALLALVSY